MRFPWRKRAESGCDEASLPAHLATGRAGEEAAARQLWKAGYRILTRNFRCADGEIDIIAEKHRIVYFVEVKTRHEDAGEETALSAVDEGKRGRVRKAARLYMSRFDAADVECRFAIVTVLVDARLKARQVSLFQDED